MSARPTVMLCTSNGTGLGHLSRVMAVAAELRDEMKVVIFTLSAAVSVAVGEGFDVEYLRSFDDTSPFSRRQWDSLLAQRLDYLLDTYTPSVLLFDGTHPYRGLCRSLERHPDVTTIWQRRAMWKPGLGHEALARSTSFDIIVEPGDFAQSYDRGLTTPSPEPVVRVNPMRYVATAKSRADARQALGLDPDVPIALVQLGAGQINDIGSMTSRVCSALSDDSRMQVVVGTSVLSKTVHPSDERVKTVRHFPLSEYFNAFDVGVLAAGYNSFHEALSLCLPALFVPNLATQLDEQAARSRYAADAGLALEWDGDSADALNRAITSLVDVDTRDRLRAAMAELPPATGAREVAVIIRSAAEMT
jgi:UDP-N-acetylglucosamine--N-acetylmuramyl-(pentapeptide) pyrophosphoryl-undecaprenol N-acetylglucosamine transferase